MMGIFFYAGSLQAQSNGLEDNSVVTVPVSEKIYMLQGPQGNTVVFTGEDGMVIADDDFLSEDIQRSIKGIRETPFKIRINTDGASSQTLDQNQSAVIIHDGITEALTQEEAANFFQNKKNPSANITLVTFSQNTSLKFNGEEIRIMVFLNENSLEDNMIYFVQSNVVYTGDNFFAGMFPDIHPERGEDVEKYTDNVSVILDSLPDKIKIIPGRGALATKDDLADFKRMLIETTAIVRAKIMEGKDLPTIQKEGLGDQWQSWGSGIVSTDQWVKAIYESIIKKSNQQK